MNSSISIASVLRRTFAAYTSQAVVLLSLAALAVVPVEVISAALPSASPALALVALIVDVVVIALFMGVVVRLSADLREDTNVKSPRQLLRAIRPVLGQLVFVGTVAGMAIALLSFAASLLILGVVIAAALGGGDAITAAIVGVFASVVVSAGPCLFLLTIWSVTAPVVVLESPGGLLALPRSHQLVRGNRRRVLATILALAIPLGLAGVAIELSGQELGRMPAIVIQILVAVLIAPIPPLAATALYFELHDGSTHASQPGTPLRGPIPPTLTGSDQFAAPTPPRA
jgi:hypothetical protein